MSSSAPGKTLGSAEHRYRLYFRKGPFAMAADEVDSADDGHPWPAGVDSCATSDAMDALGLDQYAAGIEPLWAGAKLAGPVITVALAEGPAPEGAPKLHLGVSAISRARPGDVIVMDNQERTGMGSWGGLLTRAAQARGVAGVVLNGECRDLDEARELAFPVFGRGRTPRTARGRCHEVSCGEPVVVSAVTVRTGDWVVADGSGVVFVPATQVATIRARAEELAGRESTMAALLAQGESLSDIFGSRYEDMIKNSAQGRTLI